MLAALHGRQYAIETNIWMHRNDRTPPIEQASPYHTHASCGLLPPAMALYRLLAHGGRSRAFLEFCPLCKFFVPRPRCTSPDLCPENLTRLLYTIRARSTGVCFMSHNEPSLSAHHQ